MHQKWRWRDLVLTKLLHRLFNKFEKLHYQKIFLLVKIQNNTVNNDVNGEILNIMTETAKHIYHFLQSVHIKGHFLAG